MDVQQVKEVTAGPFFRFVGSKRAHLHHILPLFPGVIEGPFVAPFLGGGAVEFALLDRCRGPVLWSDSNPDMVAAYQAARDWPDILISRLRLFQASEDAARLTEEVSVNSWEVPKVEVTPVRSARRRFYERVRSVEHFQSHRFPECVLRGARFLYLNRAGWHGLWRVNRSGQMNVPWQGDPYVVASAQVAAIRAASEAMRARDVRVECRDFYAAMAAGVGDAVGAGPCVYADPPYVPSSPTRSFTAYSGGGFHQYHHSVLDSAARAVASRGVLSVVSNSDTQLTRGLYHPDRFVEYRASHRVGQSTAMRAPVGEVAMIYDGGV